MDYKIIFLKTFCILLLTVEAYDEEDRLLAELEMADLELLDNFDILASARKQSLVTNNYREKISQEESFGIFMKKEAQNIGSFESVPFEAQRNWTLLTKPGDTLLTDEDWTRLVSYANANEELLNAAKVPCVNKIQGCTFNRGGYENILEDSKNQEYLRNSWVAWQELFSSSQEQFSSILDLITEAASKNEQPDAKSYWENLQEQPDAYSQADAFWAEINPLYQKLHKFVQTRLFNYYNITDNSTSIPAYLLGSNFANDWSHIADIILPHPQLHYDVNTYLKVKSLKQIFEVSEILTKELSLGPLGAEFWKNSLFNSTFCEDQLLVFCSKGHSEVFTCNKTSYSKYLDAFETAMSVALSNADYFTFPRRSLRYSPVDEALKGLASILAVDNLPHYIILSESVFKGLSDADSIIMTKLLLIALRVLPRMAYYYAADKWRLQELESKSENMSEAWWNLREEIQGVSGVTNGEADYLGDMHIISNRPYLYKFMGMILQFQMLAYHKSSLLDPTINLAPEIGSDENFRTLIRERAENDWSYLLNFYYGIYDVSPVALLEYFQPLENYLEMAPLVQAKITTTTTSTSSTTPKSILKNKLELDNIKNKLQKAASSKIIEQTVVSAVADNFKPKVSEKNVKQASSNDGIMYFGLGLLIGVVIILLGMGIRKLHKKQRPRNRRFET